MQTILQLTGDSRVQLQKLYNVLDMMRQFDDDIKVHEVMCLLSIALDPRQRISEIQKKLGLSPSTASRDVANLSTWNYKKDKGHKLVEYATDMENFAAKPTVLTEKGYSVAEKLAEIIRGREHNGN